MLLEFQSVHARHIQQHLSKKAVNAVERNHLLSRVFGYRGPNFILNWVTEEKIPVAIIITVDKHNNLDDE